MANNPVLTKKEVKSLEVGRTLNLQCESTRQLNSAVQTAYSARRELLAENPNISMKIRCSGVHNTLSITRKA